MTQQLTFSRLDSLSLAEQGILIAEEMERLHYVMFKGAYNLNLIGVRKLPGTANLFDDALYCIYDAPGQSGQSSIYRWAITTDPGTYWLQNPLRVEGTGILCPGQYRSCWTLGKHKGEYEALVQRKAGVFNCWRDANKDGALDRTGKVYTDAGGVNCHHAGVKSTFVNRWSALCQVPATAAGFNEIMELAHEQVTAGYGNTFSYTLLEILA